MENEEKSGLMLVSFIHPVSVVLDCDTAVSVQSCICQEIFGAKTEVYEKKAAQGSKASLWGFRKHKEPLAAVAEMEDMPLLLRVISLCDGKPLRRIFKMLVKYNNISAIMFLDAEQIESRRENIYRYSSDGPTSTDRQ